MPKRPKVALFVTCLVDLFRPNVAFSTIELLEHVECEVVVPEQQTCCGQPAYNGGERALAMDIAKSVISEFESFDYVVLPSGSCGGMLKHHYPMLLEDQPEWQQRAQKLADKTFELVTFLTEVKPFTPLGQHPKRITYHDSCAGLRELGIKEQPRQLLAQLHSIELKEHANAETCCGFGGTFCVKYPDVSAEMTRKKLDKILASGAQQLVGGDMGCLLTLAGMLKRRNAKIDTYHIAEVLAGRTHLAGIGEKRKNN